METINTPLDCQTPAFIALVIKAQADEDDAKQALLTAIAPLVSVKMNYLIADTELAQDTTQEVLIRVFAHISKLNAPAAFYFWLSKIITNEKNRALRQTKYRDAHLTTDEDTLLNLVEDEPDRIPHLSMEHQSNMTLLRQSLTLLPGRQKEVLLLHYYSDFSITEISRLLDISYQSVAQSLKTAQARLKKEITTQVGDIYLRSTGVVSTGVLVRDFFQQALIPVEQALVVERALVAIGLGTASAVASTATATTAVAVAATATTATAVTTATATATTFVPLVGAGLLVACIGAFTLMATITPVEVPVPVTSSLTASDSIDLPVRSALALSDQAIFFVGGHGLGTIVVHVNPTLAGIDLQTYEALTWTVTDRAGKAVLYGTGAQTTALEPLAFGEHILTFQVTDLAGYRHTLSSNFYRADLIEIDGRLYHAN